jgi:hypothetical protein
VQPPYKPVEDAIVASLGPVQQSGDYAGYPPFSGPQSSCKRRRYRVLAPKVLQAEGAPVCRPMVNHFWRNVDEPCVKVSGETRPRVGA